MTSAAQRPPLDHGRLASPGRPWRAVEVAAESPSTNADLAARAAAGERPGLVLVAEHQSAGRGRLDRVWVTPPRAALTFSALVRPRAVAPERWPWLPLLTGVAVADGVRRATGLEAAVKWPNDVLVGDRKLAGILVQRVEQPDGPAAVLGVGVNVSSSAEELPVRTATSLVLEGVPAPDRTALLLAVLASLGEAYTSWSDAHGDPEAGLSAAYDAVCTTLGRDVLVLLPEGEEVRGRATGIDPGGRLRVVTGSGERVLGAGDVVHVRVT